MSDVTIRKAALSDIDALIDFQQRLASESEGLELDKEVLRKGLTELLMDSNKGEYFIAENNGTPVGCHLITFEWSDWRNGMVYWLQSVYVVGSWRKAGVFRKMYENLRNKVNADPSLRGIRLYVDKSNARAMKVYEAMGMNGEHYTVYEWMKD